MTATPTQTTIKVFIKTYGCQANVADSAGIATYLDGIGCEQVQTREEADLIIVNTCAIREKAEQKLYSYLGELLPLKEEKPFLKVGVIGCVASYRRKEMLKRFDHLSFVSGARDERGTFLTYLTDVVVRLQTAKQLFEQDGTVPKSIAGGQDRDIHAAVATRKIDVAALMPQAAQKIQRAVLGGVREERQEVKKSYVNITTGCNNYCTYCIVPFTRGRETSYPIDDIVNRVTHDVINGAKEVTLIGQNVNSYQCPQTKQKFAQLLEAVAQIPGEFWVRYISPHPKDMTRDVIQAMADYGDKLCSWSHFPLQAGSTRVLDLMNRTYTKEEFLEQVAMIRSIVPDMTITTDIIVGFPGETHEEYLETLEVMDAVQFDLVYSFIYSRRRYTKAYKMPHTCSAEEKQARLEKLQSRQTLICLSQNRKLIGKKLRVLVEKRVASGKLLARTSGNVRVLLDGDDSLIGSFQFVMIENAGPVNLEAVVAPQDTTSTQEAVRAA